MEKRHIDRRLAQMEAEGTEFRVNAEVGRNVDIDVLLATLRRGRAGGRCHRMARPPRPRARAARHPPGDGVPAAGEPGAAGRHRRPADQRGGQARRHHRRWRHRRRLPRHRAPSGGGVRDPARDPAPPARRSGREQPVAPVEPRLPRHVRPRGGWRARVQRQHGALRRRRRRQRARRCSSTRSSCVDGRFQKIDGTDRELPADLVFLAMGFVGPEQGRVARSARRRLRRARQRRP